MGNKEITKVVKIVTINNDTFSYDKLEQIVDAVYEIEYCGYKPIKENGLVKVRVPYEMFKSARKVLLNLGVIVQGMNFIYSNLMVVPFSSPSEDQTQEVIKLEGTNAVLVIYYPGFIRPETEGYICGADFATMVALIQKSTEEPRFAMPEGYSLEKLEVDFMLAKLYLAGKENLDTTLSRACSKDVLAQFINMPDESRDKLKKDLTELITKESK